MNRITINQIKRFKKASTPFATITAYDYTSSQIVDSLGFPLILVGDSAAMVVFGMDTTIPIDMDEMLFLVKSVTTGAKRSLVVADMPFMSYQPSVELAVINAGRFLKESNAQAVKIEGGSNHIKKIEAIIKSGIPVMGHIGLLPQSINQMSGYKIQGKSKSDANKIKEDALAIENSGAFAIVLEGIPSDLALDITQSISIPTIGIGAGPHCDGQIQVYHDILGIYSDFSPKHAKKYGDLNKEIKKSLGQYKKEVELKKFPEKQHFV
tara:strand:+ start:7568 stop:8365 length:798 start_codon:yes stop_codon:yes gene_type:complete